jgi:ubiquinone/menaquinone biosynthesis C-methylase UbiE
VDDARTRRRFDRYGPTARWYDVLSLERPVYRAGREAGIAALRLRAAGRVLVLGCGTGLDLPLLHAAVGTSGRIVGLDASPHMLRRAAARVRRHGWEEVHLVLGDAADPPPLPVADGVDAVLFTYALSVMDDWRGAWDHGLAALRPGGRAAVVDLALPTGRWRFLAPAARLACFAGGADPDRHPWALVEASLVDVAHAVLRGGHVHVVSGTRPG